MFIRIPNQLFCLILFLVAFLPSLVSTSFKNMYVFPIVVITLFILIYNVFLNRKIDLTVILFTSIFFIVPIPSLINSITIQEQTLATQLFEYFRFASLGVFFLGCYLAASTTENQSIKKLATVVIICTLLLIIAGLYSPTINNQLFFLYYNNSNLDVFYGYMLSRPSGTFGNPNTLAMSLVFIASLFLNDKMSKIDIVALSLALILILITKSRTGLIGMVFLLLVYYSLKGSFITSFKYILIIPIIVTLGTLFGVIDIDGLSNRFIWDVNLSGRDILWITIFENQLVSDNLILGLGKIPSNITMVDNEYINILVKYGVSGLFLFFILLFLVFFVLLNKYRKEKRHEFVIKSIAILLVFLLFSFASSPLTTIKLSYVFLLIFAFYSNKVLEGCK